ncbi:MAG: ABC transporter permease [Clostridium sp.]|nr:ABC transporter permease [Acetatifactor muris]MCM1526309.1 ABC transporter permease [Bacteroides sp.]MCM1562874.1 ABC transporter permease [Clostridium sp.]
MKIRLNPIVKKDMQVSARSMRLSWGLFGYEAVLAVAFLLALSLIQADSDSIYSDGNIYKSLIALFPVLAIAQVCIVALIMPILTAGSISGEKERQTYELMMTTCMSPFSIVLGKMVSSVIRILFYVVAGLPVIALAFVAGGLAWINLLYFVLAIVLLSVFLGSIGVFCSAFHRRSISAVVMSFVICGGLNVLTFVPLIIRAFLGTDTVGESMLALLFNPFLFFEEFFMLIMTGTSLLGDSGFKFDTDDVGILTYYLTYGHVWVYASAVCILALSFVFLLLAAWKVNPMHSSSGGRVKQRKRRVSD